MHVTVIAKAPVAGRVKTRLCPPCTPAQAAELAAAALSDTLDAIDAALRTAPSLGPVRRVLLLDGARPSWIPARYETVPQCDGDLGDRLADGFSVLGPGIIVGMETPHTMHALVEGLSALKHGLDVLGPALDGGYWSIGLARVEPGVFSGIEMSTDRTGADQLERLHQLGHDVHLLPMARDIDTFDDVRALADTHLGGHAANIARRLVREHDGDRLRFAS